jgi:branched-chain amino acid transport system permease protein
MPGEKMDSTALLQAIITGLVMGGIYALVAAGLTLVFGVMRIINVAHGEFLMIAMYGSYFMHSLLGLDPYVSIVIVLPIHFLIGTGYCRLLIFPILSAPEINQVLLTVGVSIFLQNFALLLFTGDFRTILLHYSAIKIPIGPAVMDLPQLIAFLGSVAVTTFLFWLVKFTDLGRWMRAAAQNREAAILSGVDVRGVYLFTFGLGTASVGVAGSLLSGIYYITPDVGWLFLLTAFVVVVLGGMGNFVGALLGGFIIALTEAVGSLFMPIALAPILKFIIFIALLLFRPEGLFGSIHKLGRKIA